MIINNLDLRILAFVNVFLVSHFYHEPPAREIGQPLPVYLTVNKLYLYLYLFSMCLGSKALRANGTFVVFSVCLGSHALRTKNIHCI